MRWLLGTSHGCIFQGCLEGQPSDLDGRLAIHNQVITANVFRGVRLAVAAALWFIAAVNYGIFFVGPFGFDADEFARPDFTAQGWKSAKETHEKTVVSILLLLLAIVAHPVGSALHELFGDIGNHERLTATTRAVLMQWYPDEFGLRLQQPA